MADQPTAETLKEFLDAFNRHDLATLTGTTVAGRRIEVRGCDLLEFAGGRISRKDSFWKIVE